MHTTDLLLVKPHKSQISLTEFRSYFLSEVSHAIELKAEQMSSLT